MLRPLGKNILIQRKKPEEKKKGSIILTTAPDNDPYLGQVMDIGSKAKEEVDISIGDTLLIIPYAGSKISNEDDGYMLITERDILGVIK